MARRRSRTLVSVNGQLQYTSWTDKDVATLYGVEMIAATVDILTKAPGAGDAPDIEG